VREGRPYVFTDLLRRESLDEIIGFIEKHGGFQPATAELSHG
jgi:urease accessory protein